MKLEGCVLLPTAFLIASVALQIAYAAWPPSAARSGAGGPRGSKYRVDLAGWPSLPADILLQVAALVPDADVHVMACASASWRDALNRDIHSMSFTWAARDPRHGHVCAVRAPSYLSYCFLSTTVHACLALLHMGLTWLLTTVWLQDQRHGYDCGL